MDNKIRLSYGRQPLRRLPTLVLVIILTLITVMISYADIPGRQTPRGTVPNPGTQQQELANITLPAPYNVYEFVGTCAACHGGTIDQQAGHFGNWAGSSMASAARDPIFRANQIAVNEIIKNAILTDGDPTNDTEADGAGNMCFRCHSPNGWYSGRFDPTLAGDPRGTTMIHSILLSTDDEGILCEYCHRSIGNVTFMRADLDPNDPVWNMMAGIADWPHEGGPYVDQAGDPTIAIGNPYGDTTLQINDGMTYAGKYSGSVDMYFADLPMVEDAVEGWIQGGNYTGQTYGIYPAGWTGPTNLVPAGLPQYDPAGNQLTYGPDGSLPIHFEAPIGAPINATTGQTDYMLQGLSLEHPTIGNRPDGYLPAPVPPGDQFIQSPELCGSCHDLVVPILNNGMPEQRTYTEWKFSDFGRDEASATYMRCQDCHMPTMQHEYDDTVAASLNPDPTVSGWFPYAKDRGPQGGTAFHKFAGANRDLPQMMNLLYPEPDLELIGATTGNDTRIFPGMLSNRAPMFLRTQRNTEIMLLDAVDVEILGAPVYNSTTGKWDVQVKVTNNSGHRIPSGYPDGRRFWINLTVNDGTGALVYESGHYDAATAELFTDGSLTGFQRALEPFIDSDNNAVMVYERVTGTCDTLMTTCTPSPSLLNSHILFDNRLLPAGFDYAALRNAGVKFWNYGAGFVPYEDLDRYPAGQNYDIITYSFAAAPDAVLNVRAEAYWQTHTREFMEHLKTQDTSTVRPEGPPSIFEPNYPLVPNYLSDVIGLSAITDMNGQPLNDNWGGIAYAAWVETGQGVPYLVAADNTQAIAPPAAPDGLLVVPIDPFTAQIYWNAVPDADGYLVWIRYGLSDATAAWDELSVVYGAGPQLMLENTAMNVGKSYAVKVQAFNGAGYSPDSVIVPFTTPSDVPLPPDNLQVTGVTPSTIALAWFDTAGNELWFEIWRQDVPITADFALIATIDSQTAVGGTGGNNWTDTGLTASTCYNYQVRAANAVGVSTWNTNGPIMGCTSGVPTAPTNLIATAFSSSQVDLTWTASTGIVDGYRLERSLDGITWTLLANIVDPLATSYSDVTVAPTTTYWYRLFAYNTGGVSDPSNTVMVTTPAAAPAAPTALVATPSELSPNPPTVLLTWTDNATDETGFYLERALEVDNVIGPYALVSTLPANTETWLDTTVAPKTAYWYRIASYNANGTSSYAYSNRVVTPGELPEAPADLRVVTTGKTSVTLGWLDKSDNEQGFYLYRSTDGVNFVRVATIPANSTLYTAGSLVRKTTYWFYLTAFNVDGESQPTNTITVRTK